MDCAFITVRKYYDNQTELSGFDIDELRLTNKSIFGTLTQYIDRAIFPGVPTTSEINIDRTKIEDYEKLFDMLDRAFIGSENLYQKINVLMDLYIFRNMDDVCDFLEDNNELISIVAKAQNKIREFFQSEDLFLDVVTYPGSTYEKQLVINISTELSPCEAIDKLDMFDEIWWIDASENYDAKLCIQVEYK